MADSHVLAELTEPWTDEKHVRFLNAVEASFVKAMLQKRRRFDRTGRRRIYSPDRSKPQLASGGPHKNRRSGRSGPYDSTEDQVVPQFDRRSDDEVKDDSDNPPIVQYVSK